jgi:hypothetical protein
VNVVERVLLAAFVVGWYLMVRSALYRKAFDESDKNGVWTFRCWWSCIFGAMVTALSFVILWLALCVGCWIATGEFRLPVLAQSPHVERGTCAEAATPTEAKP